MKKLVLCFALLALTACSGAGGDKDKPDSAGGGNQPVKQYTATYQYPANTLLVGEGTIEVAATAMLSCTDANGVDADESKCTPVSSAPLQTQMSPAGVQRVAVLGADTADGYVEYVINEGELFAGIPNSVRNDRIAAVLTCVSGRYQDEHRCPITCPTNSSAEDDALSALECEAAIGYYDDGNGNMVAAEAGYFQPSIGGARQICPSNTYQNQTGQASCLSCTNKPAQAVDFAYTATEGKISASCAVASVTTCESGFHASGNHCYRVTEYENPATVVDACEGSTSVTQVVKNCEYGDGSTVQAPDIASHCPAPSDAPTGNVLSVAGIKDVAINNGTEKVTCSQGELESAARATPANVEVVCNSNSNVVDSKCRLKFEKIASSYDHTCAIAADKKVYCWGLNAEGQLGDGTTTSSSVPVAVQTTGVLSGLEVKAITAGNFGTCVIAGAAGVNTSDYAYCWGANGGRLGSGDDNSSTVPVAVVRTGALAGRVVKDIAMGQTHTCVVAGPAANTTTDLGYCMGNNMWNNLGTGNTTSSNVPVAMNANGTLVAQRVRGVAVGQNHSCAVTHSNAVWCMGMNLNGEVGTGSSAPSPAAVSGGTLAGKTISKIYAGHGTSCALESSGLAHCWGRGSYGQIGNGASNNATAPVAVVANAALSGFVIKSIAIAPYHVCTIAGVNANNNSNFLSCWGGNDYGQGGINATTPTINNSPRTSHSTISAFLPVGVSVGEEYTCFVTLSGDARCLGRGKDGKLGNGVTSDTNSLLSTSVLGGAMD